MVRPCVPANGGLGVTEDDPALTTIHLYRPGVDSGHSMCVCVPKVASATTQSMKMFVEMTGADAPVFMFQPLLAASFSPETETITVPQTITVPTQYELQDVLLVFRCASSSAMSLSSR